MVSSSNSVVQTEDLFAGKHIYQWLIEKNIQKEPVKNSLNKETLQKLIDGEFGISLKDFTDINSYNTTMSALYGDFSANTFNNKLNNLLGLQGQSSNYAKNFIEEMRKKGLSDKSAFKLYTAMKTYSISSTFLSKNNFINAKI